MNLPLCIDIFISKAKKKTSSYCWAENLDSCMYSGSFWDWNTSKYQLLHYFCSCNNATNRHNSITFSLDKYLLGRVWWKRWRKASPALDQKEKRLDWTLFFKGSFRRINIQKSIRSLRHIVKMKTICILTTLVKKLYCIERDQRGF